jgi:hypothetical protein
MSASATDASVLIVRALLAYEWREDAARYISCQEEAHGVRFSCAQVRRALFELLVERVPLPRRDVHVALFDPSWCPGRDLFADGRCEPSCWA